MKKLLMVLVLLVCLTGVTVFAWEPEDLTKYPSFMEAGDLILNFGVGLGSVEYLFNKDYVWIPPIRLTFDWNTPLGDAGLPFFMGGLLGYQGHFYKHSDYHYHNIPIGFRFGYHFNWDVDNLDTYAVTTAGTILRLGSGYKDDKFNLFKWINIGVNVGARYFVSDWFGFWAEAGFTSFSYLDIGFAFKF